MMRVVSFPTCYTVTLASICAKTERKKPFSRSLFSGSKPNRNRKWCCRGIRVFDPSFHLPPTAMLPFLTAVAGLLSFGSSVQAYTPPYLDPAYGLLP